MTEHAENGVKATGSDGFARKQVLFIFCLVLLRVPLLIPSSRFERKGNGFSRWLQLQTWEEDWKRRFR